MRVYCFLSALLADPVPADTETQDTPICCCCSPLNSQLQYISPSVRAELLASVHYVGCYDDVGSTFVGVPSSALPFEFVFDSGSTHHILSFDAAVSLFRDPQKSNLRVLGVSGHHTEADLQGRLVLALEDPTTS